MFLALVSGVCAWLFLERRVDTGLAAGTDDRAVRAVTAVSLTDQTYDRAVDDLTRLLAEERSHLSPKTVEIIERDLAAIDRAIAEARAALAEDPSNPFLNSHLAQQRRTKIALLRQANALARSGF